MLILTRKLGESIMVGDDIKITIVDVNKNQVKLGIKAPKNITIHREEVFKKVQEENVLSSTSVIVDAVRK